MGVVVFTTIADKNLPDKTQTNHVYGRGDVLKFYSRYAANGNER